MHNLNPNNIVTDYHKIKMIGTITIIVAIVYYGIICGVLGWEPYHISVTCIIAVIFSFILDWFLIAVEYPKKEKARLLGLKLYKVSYCYRKIRGLYIIIFVFSILLSVIGGPFLLLAVAGRAVIFVPEVAVEFVRSKTIATNSSNYIFFKKKRLLPRIDSEINSKNYLLSNDNFLILSSTNHPFNNNVHVYESKYPLLKKYLYTFLVDQKTLKEGIRYSPNGDTLYIGEISNLYPANYIVKRENKYLHTITRLNPKLSGYSEEKKEKITIKNDPDSFITETINLNKF